MIKKDELRLDGRVGLPSGQSERLVAVYAVNTLLQLSL